MNSAWLSRGVLFALLSAVAIISSNAQQGAPPRSAVPVEPIGAILDAFRFHQVVALGLGDYGSEQTHAFRLSLVRNPRFAETVNDIVVEFGNARYQDLMDRFVRGEDVPNRIVRQVWQKTTQPHAVWDKPVFEEFFQAVRAVNATLSRERQLRVLLGDPPVDWDNMHSREDLSKWMTNPLADRDRYPADVIKREVLAKHRRALLIYGATFLQRKSLGANYEMSQDWGNTIVSLLEREASMKLFTIWTHSVWDLETLQGGAGSWPVPSLAMLRGTVLGAKDFTAYVPAQTAADRVSRQDGNFVPIPSNQWRSMRMEDQFDALLYLGPPSAFTFSPQSPGLCSDPDYMEMRLRHMGLAGLPQAQADRLKQTCATQAPR